MKRSEVLEKLADLLEFLRQDLDNGSDYQDAETVLSLLEDLHMLPPNVCYVDGKWNDEKYIAHFYTHKNPNYWED